MLDVLVEDDILVQRVIYSVDAYAHESRAFESFELLCIFALSASDDGCEYLNLRALSGKHFVGNLVHALTFYFPAAFRAMRSADARVKQAEIVVNLRHGAHRGTRIVRSRLLVDGNRGGKPLDVIDVGFLHLPEELARIAGQALHIAPLSFGENGVEGKRRLARPGQPREHDKFVPRDFEVDVFQIVFLCAFDEYLFHSFSARPKQYLQNVGLYVIIAIFLSVFSVR